MSVSIRKEMSREAQIGTRKERMKATNSINGRLPLDKRYTFLTPWVHCLGGWPPSSRALFHWCLTCCPRGKRFLFLRQAHTHRFSPLPPETESQHNNINSYKLQNLTFPFEKAHQIKFQVQVQIKQTIEKSRSKKSQIQRSKTITEHEQTNGPPWNIPPPRHHRPPWHLSKTINSHMFLLVKKGVWSILLCKEDRHGYKRTLDDNMLVLRNETTWMAVQKGGWFWDYWLLHTWIHGWYLGNGYSVSHILKNLKVPVMNTIILEQQVYFLPVAVEII